MALAASISRLTSGEAARFYAKIAAPCRPESCWCWVGTYNGNGLPVFWFRGQAVPAYRVAYLDFAGVEIDGDGLRRTCDTGECVNPRHRDLI